MKRNKGNFQKSTFRLKQNHSWKAPKGYKIVVLDRGAVSFNIPEAWVVGSTEPFEVYDREPPEDETRLSTSFWRTPPGIDWSGLPLDDLMRKATVNLHKDDDVLSHSDVFTSLRTDLELVWAEQHFIDPNEKREAITRVAMARGWDVQVLITCDFWVDDAEQIVPVWDEVLRSLQLGRTIEDPTKGVTLQ